MHDLPNSDRYGKAKASVRETCGGGNGHPHREQSHKCGELTASRRLTGKSKESAAWSRMVKRAKDWREFWSR